MKGIGIIFDILAIIFGGSIGVMLKHKIPAWIKRLILPFLGFLAILFGAYSLIDGWFSGTAPGEEQEGSFLIEVALLVGTLFGEALCFSQGLDKLGGVLNKIDRRPVVTPKAASEQPVALRTGNRFIDGFALASVLCAFSSLTVTATLAECLDASHKMILIKSVVDVVVIFLLTTIYDSGVCFAVIPTLIVEGTLAVIATQHTAWLTPTYIVHLTVISSIILIGAGVNLAFGKRLRVINLLPAAMIGPLYWWAIKFVEK